MSSSELPSTGQAAAPSAAGSAVSELFSRATGADVRVRFCPSPTGTPHVGLMRTALFNWAYARHTGGKLVFRIEDTDAARDSEESYALIIEAMKWLELDWDEGVEVGGPHGPYRQSQRSDIYAEIIGKLRDAGHLYESFATAEEIEQRNLSNGRDPRQGYDNFERDLDTTERERLRAEGREPSLRLRVPDIDLSFTDLVRGDITFPAGSFPDFVLVRPNGAPLYTFVNPVDDALMGVTHVLRGEDLLSSTARQIALYLALIDVGVAAHIPQFAHLPYVMGEGNKKLSKRDPQANLFHHRDVGMIPEGLVNYLALLGWSYSADQDVFSREQMIERFDVADVLANPARFDEKKAVALNGDHIRMLGADEFASRLVPYLRVASIFGEGGAEPSESQLAILAEAAPLVQERMQLLGDAPGLLKFLYTADDEIEPETDALKGVSAADAATLEAALAALQPLDKPELFTAPAIEEALRQALIEGLGLKPRLAFGAVRTAISGRRVSPPLFESMQILGPKASAARIARFRDFVQALPAPQ